LLAVSHGFAACHPSTRGAKRSLQQAWQATTALLTV